jgi:predicted N-acyltransferase
MLIWVNYPKWGINFPFTPLAKKRLLRIRPFNQDIKLKQLLDNTDDSAKKTIFQVEPLIIQNG